MLTPEEIRNNNLKRGAMGGYRAEEVEQLLEQVAQTVEKLNARNNESIAKIGVLAEKIEEYRGMEASINSALLSAQRLGDQTIRESQEKADTMVSEAEKKATDITNVANFKAETTVSEAESNAAELTQTTKEKMEKLVADTEAYVQNLLRETTEKCEYDVNIATSRSEAIMAAAEESVQKQQALFDYYKNEITNFRANMIASFKKGIEDLEKLPAEINLDPRDLSDLVMAQPVAVFEFSGAGEASAASESTGEPADEPIAGEINEAPVEIIEEGPENIQDDTAEEVPEVTEEIDAEAADGSLEESEEGEVTFGGVIDPDAVTDEAEDEGGFKITVDDDDEVDERQGVLTFGGEEEATSGFTFGN